MQDNTNTLTAFENALADVLGAHDELCMLGKHTHTAEGLRVLRRYVDLTFKQIRIGDVFNTHDRGPEFAHNRFRGLLADYQHALECLDALSRAANKQAGKEWVADYLASQAAPDWFVTNR